jgi:hypothetical protein
MSSAPHNPLLGTWHLRRWEIAYGDGRAPTLPFGADAVGLIQYTDDGGMSACIARAGRPRLSAESMRRLPAAEAAAAFESYFQYAGRYTLRELEGRPQVVHRVTMSLNPNFVGSEQVRDMHFDADGRLTLSAWDTLPGGTVQRHHRLQWERRRA